MAGGVYETLNTSIRTRVLAELQTGVPIPTQFDNQEPQGIVQSARWLRAAIVHNDTVQIQVGALNRYRMVGDIEFNVHVPVFDGPQAGREIGVAIETAFREITAASVFYRASEHTISEETAAEWVSTYLVPFYSDFDEAPQTGVPKASDPTRDTVHDVLIEHFKAQVEPSHTDKTFFYENFEKPPASGSWARVNVWDGESGWADSVPSYRTEGNVIAEVFVPVKDGTLGQIELVDDIAKAFRAITIKGVTCRTPRVRTVTAEPEPETGREDSFWQMNVVCPFHFSDQ